MATLSAGSSIGRVERDTLCDFPFPAVAVREQAFLVVVELLRCLGRELEVRSQDDGVDRAGLLAKAAVDAFRHVDVETATEIWGLKVVRGGPARPDDAADPPFPVHQTRGSSFSCGSTRGPH